LNLVSSILFLVSWRNTKIEAVSFAQNEFQKLQTVLIELGKNLIFLNSISFCKKIKRRLLSIANLSTQKYYDGIFVYEVNQYPSLRSKWIYKSFVIVVL